MLLSWKGSRGCVCGVVCVCEVCVCVASRRGMHKPCPQVAEWPPYLFFPPQPAIPLAASIIGGLVSLHEGELGRMSVCVVCVCECVCGCVGVLRLSLRSIFVLTAYAFT